MLREKPFSCMLHDMSSIGIHTLRELIPSWGRSRTHPTNEIGATQRVSMCLDSWVNIVMSNGKTERYTIEISTHGVAADNGMSVCFSL